MHHGPEYEKKQKAKALRVVRALFYLLACTYVAVNTLAYLEPDFRRIAIITDFIVAFASVGATLLIVLIRMMEESNL